MILALESCIPRSDRRDRSALNDGTSSPGRFFAKDGASIGPSLHSGSTILTASLTQSATTRFVSSSLVARVVRIFKHLSTLRFSFNKTAKASSPAQSAPTPGESVIASI